MSRGRGDAPALAPSTHSRSSRVRVQPAGGGHPRPLSNGWVLVLLVLAVGAAVTGCSKKAAPTTEGGRAKITYWNTMGTLESEVLPSLVKEFTDQNPDIQVIVEKISFYDARNQFEQGMKAGVAPDVFRSDRFWVADFVKAGLVEELDPGIISEDLDDLVPLARQVVTIDGKVWGLPQSVDCLALFYNKAHLKEVGIEPPTDYDSFRAAARQLTDPGKGRYGFFLNPDAWWFEPFLFAFGGRYFTGDGVLHLSTDQTLKAVQFLLDLKETEKAVPPVNLRSNSYDLMMQSFRNGQVSMILNGPWSIRVALSGPAFKDRSDQLGVIELPQGPAGRHTPVGVQSLIIPKGCRHKDAALRFIRYLCSKPVEATLSKTNYGIPARKSLFSDPELRNDPFLRPFILQLQAGNAMDSHQQCSQLYKALGDTLMRILNGDIPPRDALKDLDTSWKAKP